MKPEKPSIDTELQNRIMDMMFVFNDLGDGTIKCTIPDGIFTDSQKVKIEGKEYGIYSILGMEGFNGSSKIIERMIEKFIVSHGSPTWSQIVTEKIAEESDNIVSYPKTVYLRK